jgi:hypothetical protein
MPTSKQLLGFKAEKIVTRQCKCPGCKRSGTLKRLPPNFKCADIICDFCGYLAQVKGVTSKQLLKCPARIAGAAWSVQSARMEAGIYFPLFVVLVAQNKSAVFFLAADLQDPTMFRPRRPLSPAAVRAGWRGFTYDLSAALDRVVRLA